MTQPKPKPASSPEQSQAVAAPNQGKASAKVAEKPAPAPAPEKAAPSNAAKAADKTAEGRKQQEAMLDFVRGRLRNMDAVQEREIAQTDPRAERQWGYQVADSHKQEKGLTKPMPVRWHEAAQAYEEAARAAARGDLPRAAALLQNAVAAEKKAMAELTTLVDTNGLDKKFDNPWANGGTVKPCGGMMLPADVDDLVRRVVGDRDGVKDPPVREMEERRKLAPKPEDAEKKDEDKKKVPTRKVAPPPKKGSAKKG